MLEEALTLRRIIQMKRVMVVKRVIMKVVRVRRKEVMTIVNFNSHSQHVYQYHLPPIHSQCNMHYLSTSCTYHYKFNS